VQGSAVQGSGVACDAAAGDAQYDGSMKLDSQLDSHTCSHGDAQYDGSMKLDFNGFPKLTESCSVLQQVDL
jgi:hypothetical protein